MAEHAKEDGDGKIKTVKTLWLIHQRIKVGTMGINTLLTAGGLELQMQR